MPRTMQVSFKDLLINDLRLEQRQAVPRTNRQRNRQRMMMMTMMMMMMMMMMMIVAMCLQGRNGEK